MNLANWQLNLCLTTCLDLFDGIYLYSVYNMSLQCLNFDYTTPCSQLLYKDLQTVLELAVIVTVSSPLTFSDLELSLYSYLRFVAC